MIKAILTGHTRGLGAAIAAELLARDIPLLGVARQANDELAGRNAGLFRQAQVDLANPEALAAWLGSEALRDFAGADDTLLLINNAGTLGPVGPLAGQDVAGIAQAVGLNIAAPLMLSATLAEWHAGPLRILHVSSGAARNAYSGWSIYCATKAALDHHARAVALDGRANLKICSLAPGVVDTAMQAEIRDIPAERFPLLERFQALKRDGQLATPQQAAGKLVAYLLGDAYGMQPLADLRDLPDVS